VPGDVEPAAESSIAAPAGTDGVVVESTATGAGWISTVTVAGALSLPRLSMTTSWKVTAPLVAGTETAIAGEVLVTDGFVGERAMGVVTTGLNAGSLGSVTTPVLTGVKGGVVMAIILAEIGSVEGARRRARCTRAKLLKFKHLFQARCGCGISLNRGAL